MGRTFVTNVHQGKKGQVSLRTTIPEAVATLLGVEKGDKLEWTVESGSTRAMVTKRYVAARAERPPRR